MSKTPEKHQSATGGAEAVETQQVGKWLDSRAWNGVNGRFALTRRNNTHLHPAEPCGISLTTVRFPAQTCHKQATRVCARTRGHIEGTEPRRARGFSWFDFHARGAA